MKLNLFCPINKTSYGYCSLNILKSLHKKEHETFLHLIDFDQTPFLTRLDSDIVSEATNKASYYPYDLPCLKIWHQFDMKVRIGKGLFAGMTFFEVDRLTPFEIHSLKVLDKVLVCSHWAKQICLDGGLTNVDVAPLGVDRNIFNENLVVDNDISLDTSTKFLNIGKWEIRKGHDVLLEAFNKAFDHKDNVRLIMNCNNDMVNNETWNNSYNNCRRLEFRIIRIYVLW